MPRYYRPKLALPVAASLLVFTPLAAKAQEAPPAPGAPGAPGAPTPPAPTPTLPVAPPVHGGQPGGGNNTLMPPPPPPPPPDPNLPPPTLPVAPPGRISPGLLPNGMPSLPNPALTQNTVPPLTFNPTSKAVLLRYKYTAGEVTRYHLTMDMNGSVQIGANGTKQPLKQHMEMTLSQTVKSVTGDQATIAEQISGLTLTLNGQAVPLPSQAQQQMQQPFTLVTTTRGKIVSFNAPTGAGGMMMPGMNPSQMENLQTMLPAGTITPGTSTWRSDVTSAATGVETHSKYSLDSVSSDGNTATIGQKLWLQFKPPTTGTTAMPVKMDGLMTGTGTQNFDIAAGQIASQVNDLHLTLKVTRPGSDVPINTDFQITVNMQRQNDAAATTTSPATPATPAPAPPATPAPGDEPPTNQLQ